MRQTARWALVVAMGLGAGACGDSSGVDDDDFEVVTDNQPFIGVASQSRSGSILSYYGIDKHSNWVFTPLFRGNSAFGATPPGRAPVPPRPPAPVRNQQ